MRVVTRFLLVVLALLVGACARQRPQPTQPARINDSPPERAAALNEAARLGLPAEERRWGIEEAKERKRQEEERAESAKRTVVIPMPAVNDGGTARGADGGDAG